MEGGREGSIINRLHRLTLFLRERIGHLDPPHRKGRESRFSHSENLLADSKTFASFWAH